MRTAFLTFFAIITLQVSLYANTIVDCGDGFVGTAEVKKDGIATVECKKLWCRDLENNRIMGSGDKPNNGYDATATAEPLCDSNDATGECVSCFGKRRWCPGEPAGVWNDEAGIFVRSGDVVAKGTPVLHRGVLSGNCYRWQMQSHGCGPNEVAYNDGTSWVCLKPGGTLGSQRGATTPAAAKRAPALPSKLK